MTFGLMKEYTEHVYRLIDFRIELSQTLLIAMEDQTRWASENNLAPTDRVPNYLDASNTSTENG